MQENDRVANLERNTKTFTEPSQQLGETSPKQVLETTPKKSKKWIVYSLIVILFLLVGITSYICYKCAQSNKETDTPNQTQPMPQETTAPTPIPDSTANWETYTKSSKNFGSYSIKHPKTWSIAENETQYPDDDQTITTLSMDDYKIEINAFMDGWSPSRCNFDETIINLPQTSNYESYVEINNPTLEIRRALPPLNKIWTVCTKEEISGNYVTAFPFSGTVAYTTPENYNTTTLAEMDQILSTLKFTNQSNNFSYKNFSMNYPKSWLLLDLSTDQGFPLKERLVSLYSDEKVIALSKNDINLIVTIEPTTEAEAGGIFMDDTEYNKFISDKNSITIEGSTFYLNQNHNSIDSLTESHTGPYGWSALTEYLPSKVTQSGTYKGYENVIKRNGYTYNFIVVSDSEGKTDAQTQGELVEILESINW